MKDLNIRPCTIKLLEENIDRTFFDVDPPSFEKVDKNNDNKDTNKLMGPN